MLKCLQHESDSSFEPCFPGLIKENLVKKDQLFFGQPADPTGFSFTPVEVRKRDFKVVRNKGTIIKGWMGKYWPTGDPQLLEVALSAGLGAKNSQGFGCCELVEEED